MMAPASTAVFVYVLRTLQPIGRRVHNFHSMTFSPATTASPATRRCLLCLIFVLSTVTISRAEEPLKVTACQLKKDPPSYNHKLVEITGFVVHASHNFTIYDPDCPSWPAIWLEYGGTINSGTVNCCKTL